MCVRPDDSCVRNSSYSSWAIFTKLSQNEPYYVPKRILSWFLNTVIFDRVIALYWKFLVCTTPPTVLKQFSPNFHKMILSMCSSAYCHDFWIRLYLTELLPFIENFLCAQLLLQFLSDFHQTFTKWTLLCSQAHIVMISEYAYIWQSYCPLVKISCVRNSAYSS